MIIVGHDIDTLRRARRGIATMLAISVAIVIGCAADAVHWWLVGLASGQSVVWTMLIIEASVEIRAGGPYKLPDDR